MAIGFGCPTTKDKMEALNISTQAQVNMISQDTSFRVTYFKQNIA